MKQEEKDLLLKDLCARLPYGIICNDLRHGDSKITEIDVVAETIYCDDFDEDIKIENCKPYLRPVSTMTEEEKKYYQAFFNYDGVEYPEEYIDWLNKKMFAYRTLDGKDMFELGIAIKAPEGMYDLNNE